MRIGKKRRLIVCHMMTLFIYLSIPVPFSILLISLRSSAVQSPTPFPALERLVTSSCRRIEFGGLNAEERKEINRMRMGPGIER